MDLKDGWGSRGVLARVPGEIVGINRGRTAVLVARGRRRRARQNDLDFAETFSAPDGHLLSSGF